MTSSPSSQQTQVKICGLKTPEDVECAIEAGADYIGLVIFPKSPRHVKPDQALALAKIARNKVKIVVLLVDPENFLEQDVCDILKPDFIQLHGKESPQKVNDVAMYSLIRLGHKNVIKALPIAAADDFAALKDYEAVSNLILLDAKPVANTTELPGGNGIAFDWKLLQNQKIRRPFMLAGGLNPENVAEAIRLTGAPIVDVSSGVESAPGIKDHDKIRRFIQNAKAANKK